LHDQLASASPDLLRDLLFTFIDAMMGAEADAMCGASLREGLDVDGLRFGCALGMDSHFSELFIEYERLDVDVVLISTIWVCPSARWWPTRRSRTRPPTATGSYARARRLRCGSAGLET
jgi:predicted amidohydrolase